MSVTSQASQGHRRSAEVSYTHGHQQSCPGQQEHHSTSETPLHGWSSSPATADSEVSLNRGSTAASSILSLLSQEDQQLPCVPASQHYHKQLARHPDPVARSNPSPDASSSGHHHFPPYAAPDQIIAALARTAAQIAGGKLSHHQQQQQQQGPWPPAAWSSSAAPADGAAASMPENSSTAWSTRMKLSSLGQSSLAEDVNAAVQKIMPPALLQSLEALILKEQQRQRQQTHQIEQQNQHQQDLLSSPQNSNLPKDPMYCTHSEDHFDMCRTASSELQQQQEEGGKNQQELEVLVGRAFYLAALHEQGMQPPCRRALTAKHPWHSEAAGHCSQQQQEEECQERERLQERQQQQQQEGHRHQQQQQEGKLHQQQQQHLEQVGQAGMEHQLQRHWGGRMKGHEGTSYSNQRQQEAQHLHKNRQQQKQAGGQQQQQKLQQQQGSVQRVGLPEQGQTCALSACFSGAVVNHPQRASQEHDTTGSDLLTSSSAMLCPLAEARKQLQQALNSNKSRALCGHVEGASVGKGAQQGKLPVEAAVAAAFLAAAGGGGGYSCKGSGQADTSPVKTRDKLQRPHPAPPAPPPPAAAAAAALSPVRASHLETRDKKWRCPGTGGKLFDQYHPDHPSAKASGARGSEGGSPGQAVRLQAQQATGGEDSQAAPPWDQGDCLAVQRQQCQPPQYSAVQQQAQQLLVGVPEEYHYQQQQQQRQQESVGMHGAWLGQGKRLLVPGLRASLTSPTQSLSRAGSLDGRGVVDSPGGLAGQGRWYQEQWARPGPPMLTTTVAGVKAEAEGSAAVEFAEPEDEVDCHGWRPDWPRQHHHQQHQRETQQQQRGRLSYRGPVSSSGWEEMGSELLDNNRRAASEGGGGPLHSRFVLSQQLLSQLEGGAAAATAISREDSVKGYSVRGSFAGSVGGSSSIAGQGAVTEVLRGYASGYVDGHCQALAAAHPGQVGRGSGLRTQESGSTVGKKYTCGEGEWM